jgi:hypothetical protein
VSEFDPAQIVTVLARHDVRFVVIGGLAATIHGAGWPTEDIDIVADPAEENLERLALALAELDARYDGFYREPIRPTRERLIGLEGPQLLRTRAGRIDVMKEVAGMSFEELDGNAVAAEFRDHVLRAASIETLIRLKEAAGRKKDELGLKRLREALAQRQSDEG